VADIAVAVGYGSLEAALASAMLGTGPPDLSAVAGANMAPIVFALAQSRRMARFGEDADASARVAVKNHANAARNPMAQRRKDVTLDDVRSSPVIAEPIRRLECCPLGDGAAAVVVTAAGGGRAVRVMSSVPTSDRWHPAAGFVPDPSATGRTAAVALGQAGVGAADLDIVEVHDAFAVEELEYSEAIGLCGPGEAGEAVASGAFDIGGRVAVSPSGGLLARGHPGGATGLAQIV
jgi:acetyl-CoA acetyltransferase